MIDLHCHSTASDGTVPPGELPKLADRAGLHAIALADHDTVDGIPPFLEAAQKARAEAIPAVEVACLGPGRIHVHIVGLFVNHRDTQLAALLKSIRQWRQERNREILTRLREAGCNITDRDLTLISEHAVLGRPHFAKLLVQKGYFRTPQEAFTKLIGRGKPAYVPRKLPPDSLCLQTLRNANAVTVWAHPMTSNSMTGAKLRRTAAHFKDLGLDALEAHYPEHSQNQTATVLRTAKAMNLLVSGGSDFHGDTMPGIHLGTGRGDLAVPDELLPPLRARAQQVTNSSSKA